VKTDVAAPEPGAADHQLEPLLSPRSIAIVGASERDGSIGHAILSNVRSAGFAGAIYPIHPSAATVLGLRAWPRVSAVASSIDLAVIAVPARHVESVIDDCIEAKVRGVMIISAGFAEASDAGRAMEKRLCDKVRSAGIRLIGPNCMGLINTNPSVRLNATFTPIWPPAGNIGVLSQSGALGLVMLDHARALNLGISTFISVGNKADVSGNDLLQYWRDDPDTAVIALYLESFGNPRKFARIAPQVSRCKPIVAVKSGRSAAGTRAASSHSAALANLDVAVDALFEQAGVIRTNTLEELFDVTALLSSQPQPRGPRVGVVTNAGGPGILLADACEVRGLTLPELSDATVERLRGFLPEHAGLANPIDLVGSDSPEWFERAIAIVGADDRVDAIVAIFIPPLMTTDPQEVAAGIARGAAALPAHKPVVSVFLSTRGTPDMLSAGPRGRIPSFTYPENAAMALAAAYRHACWRARPVGVMHTLPADRLEAVRRVIDSRITQADPDMWLEADDAFDLLEAVGVACARPRVASAADAVAVAESIGFPLVAKAVAPGLVHRSDVGGVIMDLVDADAVRNAIDTLDRRMRQAGRTLTGVLLQPQISDGIEALVGVTSDPVFGPLLVCGMGGVQVELLRDVAFRLPPVSDADARDMLDEVRSARLLDGYRGVGPGDRDALIETIMRVSALVEAAPEIREMDLNPVKVRAPGRGAVAVDVRIRIGPPPGDADAPSDAVLTDSLRRRRPAGPV
jgi:acetyl coenzyme A synthetase (ADP forming)-like protein